MSLERSLIKKKSLPICPAPYGGEAVGSWVARLAARYGMTAENLLSTLCPEISSIERQILLKKGGCPERILQHLTDVTNLDLSALRSMETYREQDAAWWRGWTAWCSTCVKQDLQSVGEVFGRADWCWQHQFICNVHQQPLTDLCPLCSQASVRPLPYDGRLRLICKSCTIPIDECMECLGHALDGASFLTFGSGTIGCLSDFQQDLRRAIERQSCQGPWSSAALSSDVFVNTVSSLCTAFIGPDLRNLSPKRELTKIGVGDSLAGFACAASVLAWLNGVDIGISYLAYEPVFGHRSLDLDTLLLHMSVAEQAWLLAQSSYCGDHLRAELTRRTAPNFPYLNGSGREIGPQGLALRSDYLAKKAVRAKYPKKRDIPPLLPEVPGTPRAIGTDMLHTTEVALAARIGACSQWLKGFGGNKTEALRACERRQTQNTKSLLLHTKARFGSSPVTLPGVLTTNGEWRQFAASSPFSGDTIVQHLQGRPRRLLQAALLRASILSLPEHT